MYDRKGEGKLFLELYKEKTKEFEKSKRLLANL
jgi:hypothetical protein